MKSLDVALSYTPSQLPAARSAIQRLHPSTRLSPRTLDGSEVSALRTRIEEAECAEDRSGALASLARTLVARELLAAVRSIGQWTELRRAVAAIARERPLPAYVATLWRVWQAYPGSETVVDLLAEMARRFGTERAVGHRYSQDAREWFGESSPVDSIVRWTGNRAIGWEQLSSIPESPFMPDAPVVYRVFHRTLQIGSAEQLQRLTNADILKGWWEMSGANHMDACANFLRRIGPDHWTGRAEALEHIRDNYGLPETEGAHRTFWNQVSKERRLDFREYFITQELDLAFKRDSDRHRFWMAQRREIVDVCHGTAGMTEWSLIDFRGFSVVEFFKLGNAAYIYPATEAKLRHIRSHRHVSTPSELKEIIDPMIPGHVDNRIIHGWKWQASALRTLQEWKQRHP